MLGRFNSIQDFLESINGGSGEDRIDQSIAMRINFVKDLATSKKIPLENLPTPARYLLDTLASRVLDIDNNFTVVVGQPHAGKTFFVEQLAHNIEEYLGKTQGGRMEFVALNDITMIELGNTNNLMAMSQNICQGLGLSQEEICLVTESPETALYLSTVLPRHKVILELNSDTFTSIINGATKSTSKTWRSWNVVDVDDVECTRDELLQLLSESVLKRINEKYQKNLTKRQLKSFINYCLKNMEGNEHAHGDKMVIMTPPGIWATVVRALMANYVYASHPALFRKSGELNFTKVMEKTFAEYQEYFGDFEGDELDGLTMENVSDEELEAMGMPEEIANLIRSGAGRIINIGGGDKHAAPKEVMPKDFQDVTTLGKRLQERIMGQEEAVSRVANSFLVPAAGLGDPNKPVRSFLFNGPTGVGKTALTMELAKALYKDEMNLVRIDMSEYQQPHEVAKLFGAPPGYMGFEKGGILTNAVAENPHSVVLLDEIEKADQKILDSFLQVLDAGHMTDSMGNLIDFTNTVVIMTSNIGAAEASKAQLGFSTLGKSSHEEKNKNAAAIVKQQLQLLLRAEFINRIDDIIVFNSLTQESARLITRREIDILAKRMGEKGYTLLQPSDEVIDALLVKADISKYGAREIQRVVFQNIAQPLAEQIVKGGAGKTFTLGEEKNAISIIGA